MLAGAHALHHPGAVVLHPAQAGAEAQRNLLVGETLGNELQHLFLARRQLREALQKLGGALRILERKASPADSTCAMPAIMLSAS
jgi:hypothetical protein